MNFVEINSQIIGLEKPLSRKVFEEGNCENLLDSCDEFDSKEQVELHLKEEDLTRRWSEGEMCLARWSEDGVWYRAKITCLFNLEVGDPAFTADVCFVDYGNEEHVLGQNLVASLEEVPRGDLVDETVLLNTSGIAEEEDHGREECFFSPPLHQQRHMLVADLLAEAGVTSVLDLGCNNCKLLRLLKGLLEHVTYLAGLDIDKELLEECGKMLRPLPGDWLVRRSLPLNIDLIHGSCGHVEAAAAFVEVNSREVEAVTSVELIEHLDPDTLATFPAAVLGALQPKIWLVTTPNSDFNELFPNFTGPFRHWDHRFEWSRAEFKEWAAQVVKDFPDYTVAFHGAGYWEATRESHGPASQVAVFSMKQKIPSENEVDLQPVRQQQGGNLGSNYADSAPEWVVLEMIEYPVSREETRSKEQQLADELTFHLRGFVWDMTCHEEEEGDEELAIPITTLMQFDSVAKLCADIVKVTEVLQARGFKVVDGLLFAQVEQRKSHWKSNWWPESDDSEEEENEENASEQVENKINVEKGGEDQEMGG